MIDVFAQDHVQTAWLQREARSSIRLMTGHGEFQPYVTAEEAEQRALALSEELKGRFTPVPSAETGEADALITRANERARGETISDIKADGGGRGAATPPRRRSRPPSPKPRSLEEAWETVDSGFQGLRWGYMHLLMRHSRGIDANPHLLAFRTFWRTVWVTELIGYKPYSLAQDLQIGPATKGKKVDDLAEPSAGFVEMLDQTLPEPERAFLPRRSGWPSGSGSEGGHPWR